MLIFKKLSKQDKKDMKEFTVQALALIVTLWLFSIAQAVVVAYFVIMGIVITETINSGGPLGWVSF